MIETWQVGQCTWHGVPYLPDFPVSFWFFVAQYYKQAWILLTIDEFNFVIYIIFYSIFTVFNKLLYIGRFSLYSAERGS